MSVRRATEADLGTVRELWEEFSEEASEPDFLAETWEETGLEQRVREGTVLLAEDGAEAVGFAELELHTARLGWLHTIYVRPPARRRGVGRELLRASASLLREHGITHLGLAVSNENALARSIYERLGFQDVSRSMAISVDRLDERRGAV